MTNDRRLPDDLHRGATPGTDWTRLTYGVHPRSSTLDNWLTSLHGWAAALRPEATFTHLTAARLHQLWLPPVADTDVHVALPPDLAAPRRRGLTVHRTHLTQPPRSRAGLQTASVVDTLAALAASYGVLDLVVLVDGALHLRRCTRAQIAEAAKHRTGSAKLRQALVLADGRSESPWESLLRVLHEVSGVAVTPQFVVRDQDGNFLARADLRIDGTNTLHEYDGAHHLERSQQHDDLRRLRRLDREWIRRGYTARDLSRDPLAILLDADHALGRRHDPDRIEPWLTLWRGSAVGHAATCHRTKVIP